MGSGGSPVPSREHDSRRPDAVVFDLGGVLIDWNPRYLYRTLFGGDTAAMEHFLAHVCSPAWNHRQDAGRRLPTAAPSWSRVPDARPLIEAWRARFDETMAGPIAGTVEILAALRERGVPLYALSNWWAETFPIARARFDFLDWFDGIVISGELGVAKPDPRIFAHVLERTACVPTRRSSSTTCPPTSPPRPRLACSRSCSPIPPRCACRFASFGPVCEQSLNTPGIQKTSCRV